MAWQSILSTQTDANSPINSVLMDAIRNNLEWLYGLYDGTLTSWVARGQLKTSTEAADLGALAGTKFAANKTVSSGYYTSWVIAAIDGSGHVSFGSELAFLTAASYGFTPQIKLVTANLWIQFRYIQLSRDYPVVFIARRKDDGSQLAAYFSSECAGYGHPFLSFNSVCDLEDVDVIAIELKRSPELCEHLWANVSDEYCFLRQVEIGIYTGVVRLGEPVQPLMPDLTAEQKQWMQDMGLTRPYDVTKTEATPALYAPDVKVLDFTFDQVKLAELEGK